ncbi:uncharacterized protein [Physcomitrium patens]|uniref:uncharacterized protein n=1 Tax=Physcomitrium patens TaxID=3218 RepID=UPI003CCDFAE7
MVFFRCDILSSAVKLFPHPGLFRDERDLTRRNGPDLPSSSDRKLGTLLRLSIKWKSFSGGRDAWSECEFYGSQEGDAIWVLSRPLGSRNFLSMRAIHSFHREYNDGSVRCFWLLMNLTDVRGVIAPRGRSSIRFLDKKAAPNPTSMALAELSEFSRKNHGQSVGHIRRFQTSGTPKLIHEAVVQVLPVLH